LYYFSRPEVVIDTMGDEGEDENSDDSEGGEELIDLNIGNGFFIKSIDPETLSIEVEFRWNQFVESVVMMPVEEGAAQTFMDLRFGDIAMIAGASAFTMSATILDGFSGNIPNPQPIQQAQFIFADNGSGFPLLEVDNSNSPETKVYLAKDFRDLVFESSLGIVEVVG
ncbi:MAG: hypothetical protein AAF599_01610, partial [Bacteroidota bacterium]